VLVLVLVALYHPDQEVAGMPGSVFSTKLTPRKDRRSELQVLHYLWPQSRISLAKQFSVGCAPGAANEVRSTVEGKVRHWAETGGALALSETSLVELPEVAMQRLRRSTRAVSQLNVCDNRLTTLPAAMCELHRLRSVLAHGNQIRRLPAELGKLARLQAVDLADNELVTLPTSICDLGQLKLLLLHNNQLCELPSDFGARLTQLQTLTLSTNELTTLPAAFSGLGSLEKLALSYNRLKESSLECLGALGSLRQLNISNNELATLPLSLFSLEGLEDLDLHANQIRALPEAIGRLASLHRLEVSANRLQSLPFTICHLRRLDTLTASANPLSNPPAVVVKRGMHAVRAHFGETGARRCSRHAEAGEACEERRCSRSTRLAGVPVSDGSAGSVGSRPEIYRELSNRDGHNSGPQSSRIERSPSRRGSTAPSKETRRDRTRPKSRHNLMRAEADKQQQKRSTAELWKSAQQIHSRIRTTRAFRPVPKRRTSSLTSQMASCALATLLGRCLGGCTSQRQQGASCPRPPSPKPSEPGRAAELGGSIREDACGTGLGASKLKHGKLKHQGVAVNLGTSAAVATV